jgi:two-component system sensor histidine kinase RpfC
VRRIVAMLCDIGFLSAELHTGGEVASLLFPIYYWVVLGNGFRFGVPWLFGAMLVAICGFLVVVPTTPFWRQQPHLSAGVLIGLLVIPLYSSRLVRKLSEAKRQAEAANQAKTMFLASISHELRTPLNAIMGMGALLRGTRLDAMQRDMAETVDSAARSLLAMIEDVLQFSRLEAGGTLRIQAADFGLVELLEEVRRIAGVEARRKGLRLSLHITPRSPMRLHGDRRQLRDILLNLAGNAVKFTERGGIVLAADASPSGPGRVSLRCEVSDTGIGIAPEAVSRIFDRFTQADESIINRFGGTGLGLAICRQLVERMGGWIGVESTPGVGSTFWVVIELPQAAGAEDAPALPEGGRAVLVGIAEPLATRLAAMGLEVGRAPDIAAALERDAPRPLLLMGGAATAETAAEVERALQAAGTGEATPILLAPSPPEALPPPPLRRAFACILPEDGGDDAVLRRALRLAAGVPATAETGPAEQPAAPAMRPLRILVADDNQVNRKVVTRILEQAGHVAETVTDGEQALDALAERRFDLALLDVNMPVMDGIEAARLHRFAAHDRPRLPILALTADATPETARRCRGAGMDACITKPVDPVTLLAAIGHAVGQAAPPPSAPAPPRAAPSTSALDEEVLRGLEALGDAAFLDQLLADFLQDAEEGLRQLGGFVAGRNLRQARAEAHALASSAANIGAPGLHRAGIALQRLRDVKALEENGPMLLDELRDELKRVQQAVAARRHRTTAGD